MLAKLPTISVMTLYSLGRKFYENNEMRNKQTQIYFELIIVKFIFIVMTFYKHATCLDISAMS